MPQHGRIHAVQDVTFTVHRGETLGLVGESGCGKSTLARLLVRLMEPDSGAIMLEGKNIYHFDRRMMLHFRRRVQIIFQDPMSSLNPRMTVGRIIAEPLKIHGIVARRNVKERVNELLHMVGLQPDAAQRYPHEFSSGQRQRIGIARALSLQPECIIADEPVSSLDVSIQAQILNLLAELQEKFHLTYVFISHDLSVVKHISTRVAVMYAGRIVEIAPRSQLYETPIHPYTEALLSAVPIPDPAITKKRVRLSGEPPRLDKAMHGCVFFHRCPIAKETICALNTPVLEEKRQGHWAACFLQPNAPAA
ncbi:MAG: ATP-binding cassette domain-containing protein [Desulfobacterota bacterium]|nr:ATP-binding cassette domain-containing protein [Thermodesulfobacteriota bacterium]